MRIAVIIPAAGSGQRYAAAGGVRSKLDEDLGGRPVLRRTIELFVQRDEVASITVAGPHDDFETFRDRHADMLALLGVSLCKGGRDSRAETVKAALDTIDDPEITHVAVHDAARPCAQERLIERVFDAASHLPAVIPAIDVTDTLKHTENAPDAAPEDPVDAILGGAGKTVPSVRRVTRTVDRADLVAAQTPQVFAIELLRRAYDQTELASTDDASLVERLGEPVHVVEGDHRNIKITVPNDIVIARAILGVRPPSERATHKRF